MYRKKIVSIVFIVACLAAIWGFKSIDDDPIQKISDKLDAWLLNNPQEKVYLQMDKPYYAIGDTIWFKAYTVIARKHQLSALSGVLNVDLIDDRDSLTKSIKLPITSGLTWGDITLPDSLPEGNYHIRAYTNWMRNAGEAYFFNKAITIVNTITNNVFTKADYSYSNQNDQHKTNTVINYTNLEGVPYANKEVHYQVQLGSKTVDRGKGQTDDKGNLSISFTSKASLTGGSIITNIKLDDGKIIRKSIVIKATSAKVDVQFFPEGGNLVAGNRSRVAFKAVGADGLGASVKGVITDDQNKEVAIFSTQHLGMGAFYITPENNKIYKAKLTYADGSESSVDLPKTTNQGYTLSIEDSTRYALSVSVIPGADVTASAQAGTLSLVAQANGVIYYAGKSEPGSKKFNALVLKRKFPSGIVQFTLFSATGEPLNERLVFIQNPDQLQMDVDAKASYAPRQKVKMNLNVKDRADKPATGSFSVAVTNETNVPVDEVNESTILSNLLLTSDIKGYVEKPNYYFTDINDKSRADLDVLMLTQGYRRFEWKQLLDDKQPQLAYEPEKALGISGRMKNLFGSPVVNGSVRILSNKGGFFMIDTLSNQQGKFNFGSMFFADSTKFVIQGRTAKDRKNVQIDVDSPLPQSIGPNKNAPDMQVDLTAGLAPFLQSNKAYNDAMIKAGFLKRPIMLQEVVIREKKNPVEHSQNLNGAGNADMVIMSDRLGNCGNFLYNCLQGLIPGVLFKNGIPYNTRTNGNMAIVVDGTFVEDDVFQDIDPTDVESVEALVAIHYTSIYGSRGANGILLITTKRGRSNTPQRYAPGVITYMPKGYYKAREFYAPKYDDPKTNTAVPDLRNTVYWKPNIITDKEGKASIEYFNGDAKGTYRVVIEGIDADGNLGRQVYRYKVE
jgi:hypothetical protein